MLIDKQEVIHTLNGLFIDTTADYSSIEDAGYNHALADAIATIRQMPEAGNTYYGFELTHLAAIASVMRQEGITPQEAFDRFKDAGWIAEAVMDEIHRQQQSVLESMFGGIKGGTE